jgi:hypothetical protein
MVLMVVVLMVLIVVLLMVLFHSPDGSADDGVVPW